MTRIAVTDQALLDEILACETAVWQALQNGDAEADLAALHPEFLGVYPSGFSGREGHADQLTDGPTVADFSLSQARLLQLGPDCLLLAYRADYLRPAREAEEAMFVSSIWQRSPEGWKNIFSQDCEALPEGAPNPLP
ncbi:hypothetical protein RSK20926_17932 [Roseobacter sp. SK209-2-6]|uniref:nuclear transport factor 2 family protein n=1 Tax=Roseobacter sp. SK209-2-6 TaxID=388739 RepID=UPI0000F3F688|nr:nuclear transport factor 2 family protein [Roseobacter sp. SK209-2-6]EBA17643.1 hypothetical protein RSK20926_17932 [Roseobacter sp. SK209-2-6]